MPVYIIIGAAAGLGHLFVLSRFTKMVTSGGFSVRTALFALGQFLLPLVVLLVIALINKNAILWAAAGMAAAMIAGSVIRFAVAGRKKGREDRDD